MDIGVHLTVVANQGEADIVCSMLRAEGIKCGERQTDLSAQPFLVGYGGWREILVAEADLEAARELLAAHSP